MRSDFSRLFLAIVFGCFSVLQLEGANYRVFVTNERSGDLTIIDGVEHKAVATVPVGKRPRGIQASKDGKLLFIALSGTPISGPPALDAQGNPILKKPTHRRATNLNIQSTPDCLEQDSTECCEGSGSSPSPFLREKGRGEGSPLRLSTLLFLLVLGVLTPLHSESVVLFKTGFEAIEGYDPQFNLVGQRGWTAEGSGGNGLITQIEGLGQQAYIGFTGPTNQDDFTTIFKPINFQPVAGSTGIIKFSVLMQIVPSTNGFDDDFRWSVYNNDESPVRLLTIDFEGKNEATGDIAVILDDDTVLATGYEFGYDGFYTLTLWMDVKRNLWSAYLNDFVYLQATISF